VIAVVDGRQAAVNEGDAVRVAVHHPRQLCVGELVDAPQTRDGEAADHRAVVGVEDDQFGTVERGDEQTNALEAVAMVMVMVMVMVMRVVVVIVVVVGLVVVVIVVVVGLVAVVIVLVVVVIVLVVVLAIVVVIFVDVILGMAGPQHLADGIGARADGALCQGDARPVEEHEQEDDP
jgi:hypothetical protein